jgi:hypothetical protein
MRTNRIREDELPVVLVLIGSLLSSYVVGLPILFLGMVLALRPRA